VIVEVRKNLVFELPSLSQLNLDFVIQNSSSFSSSNFNMISYSANSFFPRTWRKML